MNFQDAPLIPAGNIFRERRVSREKGEAVVAELARAGTIQPERTSTGRVLLTPRDGRILFDAL